MHAWSKRLSWGLVGLLMGATLAARLIPGPRTIDDAYITFRYARNILAGIGPVYNPGERVLGTTTPLYTLVLTLLGALSGGARAPFPWLALGFNALCDALTGVLFGLLGRRLGRPWAGWTTAALWAGLPFSVTFAIGGMETSLFVLLLTLTVWLYLNDQPLGAALVAALSLLTRPEAVLLALGLGADWLWRHRRAWRTPATWKPLAAFVLPLGLWTAWATAYYGSPIPLSVLAKRVAYLLPPQTALIRLLQHYATPFMGHLTFGIPWIGVGLVLYPFLFILGARYALRHEPRLWPWVLFPWVYFAAYALANPLLFRWYLTPPLPAYLFFIVLGLAAATQRLSAQRRQALRAGLTVALLALVLHGWTLHPDHGPTTPAPRMAWFKLELRYREAADRLRPLLQPGDVLAAADIGTLGYFTNAPILDTLGLISPQVLPYYPLDPAQLSQGVPYAVPTELVLDLEPDYLVFLEVYIRHTLLSDPRFQARYEQMSVIPTDIYGSRGMFIFRRRPHP